MNVSMVGGCASYSRKPWTKRTILRTPTNFHRTWFFKREVLYDFVCPSLMLILTKVLLCLFIHVYNVYNNISFWNDKFSMLISSRLMRYQLVPLSATSVTLSTIWLITQNCFAQQILWNTNYMSWFFKHLIQIQFVH